MKYFILFVLIVASCLTINILTGSKNDLNNTESFPANSGYSTKMLGDMIRSNVKNYNGDNLGFIRDIVIDTKTNEVNYVVLSYTRDNKLFAVPLSALKYDSHNSRFILDMNYNILDHLEGFNVYNWPEYADPRLALGTEKFLEAEKSWAYTFSRWESIISGSNYDYKLTKLSDLLNYKIESENGDIIGYVNDLVLNDDNHIEYIAVFIWDSSFNDLPFKFEFIPFKELVTDTNNSFKVKSRYFRKLYTDNYSDYSDPYSMI